MKHYIMVNYKGAPAKYLIRYPSATEIEANLITYLGDKQNMPRQYFYFDTQGHCTVNYPEEGLLKDQIFEAATIEALAQAL